MNYRAVAGIVGSRVFLLLLLVELGPTTRQAAAKQLPSAPKYPASVTNCSPVRSDQYDGLAPLLPTTEVDPKSAAKLKLAYRQISHAGEENAGRDTLEKLREHSSESNDCTLALALFGLGEVRRLGPSDDAAQLFQLAKEMFLEMDSLRGAAWAEFRLGLIDRSQKRFAEATGHYENAITMFEDAGDSESALLTKLSAQAATKQPDYAPLTVRAQQLKAPCLQATIENAWATQLWRDDHFAEAEKHYEVADKQYGLCPRAKAERASLQTAMGRMERQQGRPFAALEHYKLALSLQQQSGDTSLVPQTYNAMGVAYEALHDYPHAIARYKQGLAYARQIHSQQFIEFLEGNLAATYSRNQQPQLALPLLKLLSENVSDTHLRCVRMDQLGTVYSHLRQDERAVAILRKGKEACVEGSENERVIENAESLSTSELRLNQYQGALEDAEGGLSLLEEARSHLVATDAHKQGFSSTSLAHKLYSNAIAAMSALKQEDKAFELAEQARGRAFLDLLASHQEITKAPSDSKLVARFRKDLIDSPAHAAPLDSLAMLDEITRLNSTLVGYWVADDCVYIWVAHNGVPLFEVRQSIADSRLTKLIEQTRSTSAGGRVSASPAWRELYRILIAPIESRLPATEGALLTIVPSGPLFSLSFAALKGSQGRYLTERYRLHTSPSVSLLRYTRRNAEANVSRPQHYLLIADPQHLPVGSDNFPLAPLPGTALETNAIAHMLPSGSVTRLSGRDANLEALISALPQATSIHFATHAVLNDIDSYASFLALDDTKRDGRLTVAQIYGLTMPSRLVVLSACSTGLGKITGDGVAGMSRAFFYAGAASVMTTMWDIADQPTAELQPRIYAALNQGQSASEALRTAQLSMLSDLRHHRLSTEGLDGVKTHLPENPIYWASFSLSGQP